MVGLQHAKPRLDLHTRLSVSEAGNGNKRLDTCIECVANTKIPVTLYLATSLLIFFLFRSTALNPSLVVGEEFRLNAGLEQLLLLVISRFPSR